MYPLLFFLLPLFLLLPLLRPRYSPGPIGFPVIGNILMMGQLTHRGLAKLACRYGGLFHSRWASFTWCVSPLLTWHATSSKPRITSSPITPPPWQSATLPITVLTWWRQMRKLFVIKLFSRQRIQSWHLVRSEVDCLVRSITTRCSSPVNLGELLFGMTMNITFKAVFGSSSKEGQKEFTSILQEYSKLFGEFNVADFLPFLKWVGLKKPNRRLVKVRKSLDRLIDKIIDEHMQKTKVKEEDEDMVDELSAFYGEDEKITESDGLKNAIKLTRENIKGILMDVMFGGTETVASTTKWAMAELMQSPENMKRVQQELIDIVGLTRQVNKLDLDKLTFFRCCIKETLRLHPPVPFLLHETVMDTVVSGYLIPKGCMVIINAWAIGRESNSWSGPDMFNPARFMKDGAPNFNGNDFEFIPFGSGRSSCPGIHLGLYALELTTAYLLHNFAWELLEVMNASELNMDDTPGLTAPRASRLIAKPTPRLLFPIN